MKILLINKFFYRRGGAETYFFDLAKLLESRGHEVAYFCMRHNENFETEWSKYFVSEVDLTKRQGAVKDAVTAARFIYNIEAKKKLKKLLREFKPDIIHLHNIYHQLSSSVLDVLKGYGAPKVMTLHDYKLICPNYSLFTKGEVCERCFRHKYHQAVINRCVQDSYSASALAALEMSYTKARQIYENVIDCFVSPSAFLSQKLADWRVKTKRVERVPNFVFLDDFKPNFEPGRYYLYFGRISPEKGISDLLNVFGHMASLKLKIAGTGPLEASLFETAQAQGIGNVEFLGYQKQDDLKGLISGARAVIVPTLMHDNYPYSVLEAQAMGKPVIASKLGGIPEMVKHEKNGYLYEPRNHFDLKARIQDLEKYTDRIEKFGKAGRERVEKENSETEHYKKIIEIYKSLK